LQSRSVRFADGRSGRPVDEGEDRRVVGGLVRGHTDAWGENGEIARKRHADAELNRSPHTRAERDRFGSARRVRGMERERPGVGKKAQGVRHREGFEWVDDTSRNDAWRRRTVGDNRFEGGGGGAGFANEALEKVGRRARTGARRLVSRNQTAEGLSTQRDSGATCSRRVDAGVAAGDDDDDRAGGAGGSTGFHPRPAAPAVRKALIDAALRKAV